MCSNIILDNQQTVQFPVFQGERVNCEDNTSLGEFTLAPIPPMISLPFPLWSEALLTLHTEPVMPFSRLSLRLMSTVSSRLPPLRRPLVAAPTSPSPTLPESFPQARLRAWSAVSISNQSDSSIIWQCLDAEKFKSTDDAFSKKFESKQQLEAYIARVEDIVSDPTTSLKFKRGTKEKIESALSDAMAQLEIEDSTSDDLKKKELALKRLVTKASMYICKPCEKSQTNLVTSEHPLNTHHHPHQFSRHDRVAQNGANGFC